MSWCTSCSCVQCGITLSWDDSLQHRHQAANDTQVRLPLLLSGPGRYSPSTVYTRNRKTWEENQPKASGFLLFSFVSKGAGIWLYHYHTAGTKAFPWEKNGTSTWFCMFSCSLRVEGKDSLWLFPLSALIIDPKHSENGVLCTALPEAKSNLKTKCVVL